MPGIVIHPLMISLVGIVLTYASMRLFQSDREYHVMGFPGLLVGSILSVMGVIVYLQTIPFFNEITIGV